MSFTLLKLIDDNKIQEAVEMLMGLPSEETKAMSEGKEGHKLIEQNRLKLLDGFSDEFEDEKYYRIKFNDNIELSGIIDRYYNKEKTIVDWKFSSRHAREQDIRQLQIYRLFKKEAEFGKFVQLKRYKRTGEIKILSEQTYSLNDFTEIFLESWINECYEKINYYLKKRNA